LRELEAPGRIDRLVSHEIPTSCEQIVGPIYLLDLSSAASRSPEISK
jgi:hypothetical protein